jgi:RNA polymerase sigma factor (sigma-70 family)
MVPDSFVDAIALNDLLERLAQLSERAARVVEMRVFAGMTVPEIAAELDVSERTVKGDWRMARAWLKAELQDRLTHEA